jgi:hypothetical protein
VRAALFACALVGGAANHAAAGSLDPAASQRQIVVYVHTVATTVTVTVDGLTIHRTGQPFGVWNYQFNLSSWLDTEPHTLAVLVHFGNAETAYCTIEVRSAPAGDPAAGTILAKKTVRAREADHWNRTTSVVSLEIARPAGNVRPLWFDHDQADLQAVTRDRSEELVKEVFDALRSCNLDALMTLVDPALTNQALMEGADPELVKQTTRARLRRDCIPGIAVAKTRPDFHQAAYEDVLAPLDFGKLVYKFTRDETRSDRRGSLFTPTEPIVFKTKDNREFVAGLFLSYTDDKRNRRFVSRFLFERSN